MPIWRFGLIKDLNDFILSERGRAFLREKKQVAVKLIEPFHKLLDRDVRSHEETSPDVVLLHPNGAPRYKI
jgi:hypothetical protein